MLAWPRCWYWPLSFIFMFYIPYSKSHQDLFMHYSFSYVQNKLTQVWFCTRCGMKDVKNACRIVLYSYMHLIHFNFKQCLQIKIKCKSFLHCSRHWQMIFLHENVCSREKFVRSWWSRLSCILLC